MKLNVLRIIWGQLCQQFSEISPSLHIDDVSRILTDCRLSIIIDATGAASYHGFLPVVMRDCIQHMIGLLLIHALSVCYSYHLIAFVVL